MSSSTGSSRLRGLHDSLGRTSSISGDPLVRLGSLATRGAAKMDRFERAKVGAALAAAGLALVACSGPTTSPTPNPSTSSPSATGSPPTTPPPTSLLSDEDVVSVWELLHSRRLALTLSEEPIADDAFEDIATPAAASSLRDLVGAGRSDVDQVLIASELRPVVTSEGSVARVEDCISIATGASSEVEPADASGFSQVWTGELSLVDGELLVSVIEVGVTNCVPDLLNRELLAAYVEYHETWTGAWDPPNPDDPALARTMTGRRLTEISEALRADLRDGVAFRDPHDPAASAVVFDLGTDTATISDCHLADAGFGVFDLASGDRLDDPPRADELQLTSVELVRIDGRWLVEQAALLADSNCTPGGTRYVVAP